MNLQSISNSTDAAGAPVSSDSDTISEESSSDGPIEYPDRWYCVMTKPHEERHAEIHLKRQNFITFLPFLRSKRYYRRKLQWITSPMFRRYLFINIHDLEMYPKIRSTRGVSKIISFGNEPTKVPAKVVQTIRTRCENGVLVIREEEFKSGESVEIIGGPYRGMEAIFDRYTSNDDRVVLLLEIMANEAKVEIDREWIIKNRYL